MTFTAVVKGDEELLIIIGVGVPFAIELKGHPDHVMARPESIVGCSALLHRVYRDLYICLCNV